MKQKKVTNAMIHKYVKREGAKCPNCGSGNIGADSVEGCGDFIVFATVRCYVCTADWADEYTLTGFGNLSVPDKAKSK